MFSTNLKQVAVDNGTNRDYLERFYPRRNYLHVLSGTYTFIYKR